MPVTRLPVKQKKVVTSDHLTLPEDADEPKKDLHDYSWLIYGPRKIGKTSLLSQFENSFFLMFEKGAKALKIRKRQVDTWEQFQSYVNLLEKNPDYCKTLILDTGGGAYAQGMKHIIDKHQLTDIRDKAWGGGYTALNLAFADINDRLDRLDISLVATAHSVVKTLKNSIGEEYEKITVELGKGAFTYYMGFADTVAYFHYNAKGERVLTIRGSQFLDAGTRCKEHFMYTNGKPITDIPMGKSEEQSFKNLEAAFYNRLEDLNQPLGGVQKKKVSSNYQKKNT